MNKKKIVLKINDDKCLEISGFRNNPCQYDTLTIYYVNKNRKFKLYEDQILSDLDVFKEMLQKALNHKLCLDNSIQKSIGFIWNEKLHAMKSSLEKKYFDVEDHYSLWSSGPDIKYSTWLYNKGDLVFLEISPDYPWHFSEPEKKREQISYVKWMMNYKPLFVGQIDRSIIQEWIEQIDAILIKMTDDEA